MDTLYQKLVQYNKEDYYPMHMPGHKRNTTMLSMVNPYEIDITEIDGFDNLHHAEGILKDLSLRVQSLFGAEKSFLLINGSTAGILAGISAATNKGDKILVARNSHKSVYHAVVVKELNPIYIYPQQGKDIPIGGGILSSQVEALLIKNPDVKLVVITSPTYEGVVSDVEAIATIIHQYGALLLVDEAHGAHFGFHPGFPQSAIKKGADLVIQSIHKTLPAFTQTALLHSNKAELNERIEKYLSIYQSSSPSYLLMAGIDCCISLLEKDVTSLFEAFDEKLKSFYQSMKELKNLQLLDRRMIDQDGIYDLDPSKLTISVKGLTITGPELNNILREKYHIVMEMEAKDYVLGMTSICDTKEGFDRLKEALLEIEQGTCKRKYPASSITTLSGMPEQAMLPHSAIEQKTEHILLAESAGRISAVFVSIFPPGTPLLVPGEIIKEELLYDFHLAETLGLAITGLSGSEKEWIEVVHTAPTNRIIS